MSSSSSLRFLADRSAPCAYRVCDGLAACIPTVVMKVCVSCGWAIWIIFLFRSCVMDHPMILYAIPKSLTLYLAFRFLSSCLYMCPLSVATVKSSIVSAISISPRYVRLM